MAKPLASLSLDLDNKWSYLKTHGDEGWESFPSYLDVVVPRVLDFLAQRQQSITFFVVGQDAAIDSNVDALRAIADAGHEIGNHSFHHEPWLQLYSPEEIREEISRAEAAIAQATGRRPLGFRGPGFSFSKRVLEELASRGYVYDASTFPTFLGPLARMYYFFTSRLTQSQREERKQLFGKMSEGFRPIKPYVWNTAAGDLIEIPVTTLPLMRLPIHLSYLLYLSQFSRALATWYFRTAISFCRLFRVEPSVLLHPLDFLGSDDDRDLAFFPAMNLPAAAKVALVGDVIDRLRRHYHVVTLSEHARAAGNRLAVGPSDGQLSAAPIET